MEISIKELRIPKDNYEIKSHGGNIIRNKNDFLLLYTYLLEENSSLLIPKAEDDDWKKWMYTILEINRNKGSDDEVI